MGGKNPYAPNADKTALYFGDDGIMHYIAHCDNDKFFDLPGMKRVELDYEAYAATKPVNDDGVTSYHDLHKAAAPHIEAVDMALAAKVTAAADATITKMQARAALVAEEMAALQVKLDQDIAAFEAETGKKHDPQADEPFEQWLVEKAEQAKQLAAAPVAEDDAP